MKPENLKTLPFLGSKQRKLDQLEERVSKLKTQLADTIRKRDEYKARARDSHPQPELRQQRIGFLSEVLKPALIDHVIHVSLQNRYVYVSTPKVACSSVKLTLQQIELGMPELSLEGGLAHSREMGPFLRPSQLANFEESLHGGDFFCFVFVRNPYTRLLSAYLDKMRGRGSEKKAIVKALGRPESALEEEISFADFLQGIALQLSLIHI